MTITVFIDGLCEPINPGGVATYGLIVYREGRKVHGESQAFGEGRGMSNNVAEYQALCAALRWFLNRGLEDEEVVVKSDSKLLVNQMSGSWKCHGGLYVSRYREAQSLAQSFKRISYVWVPREENSEADNLTRHAYEEYCRARGTEPAKMRR